MATREELRAAYEAGATISQVARQFGMDPSWVSRKIKSSGAAMRPRGAASPKSASITNEMVRMSEQGKLHKQIAYEFGVSRQAVSRRLIAAGLRRYAPSMGA